MAASEPQQPPPPQGTGEDDIIELTEVVEDAPGEVVLDLRGPEASLDFLKRRAPPEEKRPPESPEADEESLDDLLASLPDLPEDLDIPSEAPPLKFRGEDQALSPDLRPALSDDELRELVRQEVRETVERLVREMLPDMAQAALDREMDLLRKRLRGSE